MYDERKLEDTGDFTDFQFDFFFLPLFNQRKKLDFFFLTIQLELSNEPADCMAFTDLRYVKSQSLFRFWKSFNSQSSAMTIKPSRLTAAPLMSEHALWQIYGYMRNAAKLSRKNIFFMHFHPLQKRQAR